MLFSPEKRLYSKYFDSSPCYSSLLMCEHLSTHLPDLLNSRALEEFLVPFIKGGVLFLDIRLKEFRDSNIVPSVTTMPGSNSYQATAKGHLRDERYISDSRLVADEPLLLREHAVEDAEHTLDLVLVALNRAGHLFGVVEREPAHLAEVRALAGRLEVEPLELTVVFVGARRDRDLALLVVLVDDVLDYSVGLPVTATRGQKVELDIRAP